MYVCLYAYVYGLTYISITHMHVYVCFSSVDIYRMFVRFLLDMYVIGKSFKNTDMTCDHIQGIHMRMCMCASHMYHTCERCVCEIIVAMSVEVCLQHTHTHKPHMNDKKILVEFNSKKKLI